jgi:SWI/SNF related-matrix-associated actin-dependent regulator of chromatin subfamily C
LQEDEEGKLFKRSPKLYRFYRNFIINLWKENSKKYLSAAVCRRSLPGDVSSIIRIHAFLEHWGLINFPSKERTKEYLEERACEYCCHVCQEEGAK